MTSDYLVRVHISRLLVQGFRNKKACLCVFFDSTFECLDLETSEHLGQGRV